MLRDIASRMRSRGNGVSEKIKAGDAASQNEEEKEEMHACLFCKFTVGKEFLKSN